MIERNDPIDFIGEVTILAGKPCTSVTIETTTPCTVLYFSRKDFEDWIAQDIHFLRLVSRKVAYKLYRSSYNRGNRLFYPPQHLLLAYFLQYIEEYQSPVVKRTREEIHEETGISVKTLNRTIRRLKEEGLVGNKMPLRYVAEMVCDRIAACEVYKGKDYTSAAPWEYYERTRRYITIHPETRALLEKVRNALAARGELRHPDYANSIGYVSAELNVNLEEAEKLIRQALSVDANNPAYLDSLAWVLFRRGKFDEADAEIRRAIRFARPGQEMGVLYWHAGEIAAARGKRDEARRFYLMALAERDRELDRAAVEKRLKELESEQ